MRDLHAGITSISLPACGFVGNRDLHVLQCLPALFVEKQGHIWTFGYVESQACEIKA
jgi:hypothetical protein